MTPWLHLLFIPAVLFVGIQIGIQIGLRLAAKGGPTGAAHEPTGHALSFLGAVSK